VGDNAIVPLPLRLRFRIKVDPDHFWFAPPAKRTLWCAVAFGVAMGTHVEGERDSETVGGRASYGTGGNGCIVAVVLFGAALITLGWIVLLAWGALQVVHGLAL
jgi:hypothetical protein